MYFFIDWTQQRSIYWFVCYFLRLYINPMLPFLCISCSFYNFEICVLSCFRSYDAFYVEILSFIQTQNTEKPVSTVMRKERKVLITKPNNNIFFERCWPNEKSTVCSTHFLQEKWLVWERVAQLVEQLTFNQ